jgi:hypothetical protein
LALEGEDDRSLNCNVEIAFELELNPKKSVPSPRRVWRMTADTPMGEYLELVPKSAYDVEPAPPPKRVFHPEVRDPIYKSSPADKPVAQAAAEPAAAASGPSILERRAAPRQAPSAADAGERSEAPAARAKVLNPGQVPNWRASSYDLLTGLTVHDVTDTIPGEIFDELFKPERASRSVQRRR